MVFRVIVPTTKSSEVVEWIRNAYNYEYHPFHEDYLNDEMSTTQFLFNNKLVAQVVSLQFGDGTYREF
jgi:hypothetical protein